LWQALLQSEEAIQTLLKNSLETNRMQIQYLQSRSSSQSHSPQVSLASSSPSAFSPIVTNNSSSTAQSEFLSPPPRIIVGQEMTEVNNNSRNNNFNRPRLTRVNSEGLRSFVSSVVSDEQSISVLLNNFASRHELLSIESRDALKLLNLPLLAEQSVWDAILSYRQSNTSLPLNHLNHQDN
jgi:hypothetical protein